MKHEFDDVETKSEREAFHAGIRVFQRSHSMQEDSYSHTKERDI